MNPPGLQRLAGEFFSEQLDRERPLWQILLVPSLAAAGRRCSARCTTRWWTASRRWSSAWCCSISRRTPTFRRRSSGRPTPGPAGLRLAVESVADGCLEQFRNARRAAALGMSPRRTLRVAETMRRAALSLAEDALRPAPPSYLNAPIGPRRAVVTHRISMRRLTAVKQRCAVKLNDVALAVVAGALRRLALRRGEEPKDLRVMVPVSVRSSEEAGTAAGNRITFAFLDLPVSEPDAFRRLLAIRAQTLALKDSGRIEGSDLLLRSVALLPEPVKEKAARLAASPRMYNLTVSNVPGPRVPLLRRRGEGALDLPDHPDPGGARALDRGAELRRPPARERLRGSARPCRGSARSRRCSRTRWPSSRSSRGRGYSG